MPDEPIDVDHLDCGGSCERCVCRDDGDQTVRQIMAKGYAIVMVVLAVGFVAFVAGISVLAFFYPEKATNFLTLYAIPVAALLGVYGVKAKNAWLACLEKKKD